MNIAIIGTGTLGSQVATLAALQGHQVAIYDVNAQILQQAQLRIARKLDEYLQAEKITLQMAARARQVLVTTTELEACGEADILIEAAPEALEVKRQLIEKLDRFTPLNTPIATTAANHPITAIASAAQKMPQRIAGLHFFGLTHMAQFIEVVRGDQTAPETITPLLYVARQMAEEVAVVNDVPGFLLQRVSNIYTNEALHILGEGNTDTATLDKLMESLGFDQGPIRKLDEIGIEESQQLTQHLYNAYYHEPRYRPHHLLDKLVQSGRQINE